MGAVNCKNFSSSKTSNESSGPVNSGELLLLYIETLIFRLKIYQTDNFTYMYARKHFIS